MATLKTQIDTTFITSQRGMFDSGLAAQVGMNAYGVWTAIKMHADFESGEAWCGMRRLATATGLSVMTVQRSIKVLLDAHLLRVKRREGQRVYYIARERLDLRIGNRVLLTAVMDYVPNAMRSRLDDLRKGGIDPKDADVHSYFDLIPGPGVTWDAARGVLTGKLRADEVPYQEDLDLGSVLSLPKI